MQLKGALIQEGLIAFFIEFLFGLTAQFTSKRRILKFESRSKINDIWLLRRGGDK